MQQLGNIAIFVGHFCSLTMPQSEIEICKHMLIVHGIPVTAVENGPVWNHLIRLLRIFFDKKGVKSEI